MKNHLSQMKQKHFIIISILITYLILFIKEIMTLDSGSQDLILVLVSVAEHTLIFINLLEYADAHFLLKCITELRGAVISPCQDLALFLSLYVKGDVFAKYIPPIWLVWGS